MVAFIPPRKGIQYSEALAEAYAVAPEDEVVLDTLEFLHPTFLDADNNPIRIRVVNDYDPLVAFLEVGAPLDGATEVTFDAARFKFQRPAESESSSLPELEIQVDNVSQYLMPYLERAKESRQPLTIIWRPYCMSDLSGPHINPPIQLTMRTASASMTTVSGRAGFADLANRRFPAIEYIASRFPNLVER